jgi:PAT family beta-lactamase induction signal transducer AmpG
MAAGALSATLVSKRVRLPVAFLLVCLVNEATLAVLWLGPLWPFVYLAGTMVFLFTIGACFSFFTAVVLELLGSSGKSGSARYSIINSLGNIPFAYMVLIDGKSYARWGARAMPGVDATLGAVGGAILLAYFLIRPRGKSPEQEYA